MFDSDAVVSPLFDADAAERVDRPEDFIPNRPPSTYLLFGTGRHECVAKQLVEQGLPRLVASFFLNATIVKPGSIAYDGPAVARYKVNVHPIQIPYANLSDDSRTVEGGDGHPAPDLPTQGAAQ
jgi:hypothetical protein